MPPEEFSESDFRVLGLRPGADPTEIKRAYRNLAKKWHPDRFHSGSYEDRAFAEENFRKINEAYERIIRNRWRAPGPRPEPRPAGSGVHEPEAAPERPEGAPIRSRWSVWREKYANRAARACFLAVMLALLLIQSNTDLPLPERQPGVVPPPIAQDRSAPAPEKGPPEPSVDKLLSEILPPSASPPSMLQSPPENAVNHFTIGSTLSEVLRVQGKPSRVQGQTWYYGLSEINFRQGLVWRFNNFDGSLRVRMLPRGQGDMKPPHFTIGSTEDEVLQVQGTPTRFEHDKWYYGFAEVRFKDGRVKEFDNYFGTLRVRLQPAVDAGFSPQKYFFTIGSTPDEVLAVQGTPTTIQGNVWSYNFSYVFFRDKKVSSVSDSDHTLRFISPEDLPNSTAASPPNNSGS